MVVNKLTLIEKDSTKLTATVTPDDAVSKNVTWFSSDESVAKVAADGTVTGVKAGNSPPSPPPLSWVASRPNCPSPLSR